MQLFALQEIVSCMCTHSLLHVTVTEREKDFHIDRGSLSSRFWCFEPVRIKPD